MEEITSEYSLDSSHHDNDFPSFDSNLNADNSSQTKHFLPQNHSQPSTEHFALNAQSTYRISKYDDNCEDHSKIEYLIPINYSKPKLILFTILNLCTAFLITLFVIWFPSLKLKFIYSISHLSNAKYIVVYGTDKEMKIIPLERKTLPNIANSFLKSEFNSNLPKLDDNVIFFTYKLYKYIYIPALDEFSAFTYEIASTYNKIHRLCTQGLSVYEVEYQRNIFGECDLFIEIKSCIRLLLIEFTDPFYIFQVGSVILWMFNEYKAYATLIIVATCISLIVGTYETRSNLLNVQQMAHYSCLVNVYRRNIEGQLEITPMPSTELVPGDLFEIQDEGLAMPCDCVLINGTVIINEAMLTGESTPIIKGQIPRTDNDFDIEVEKKKLLFAGTTVIQKRTNKNEKCLALVYSTGFNTVKGSLIRSILFPKQGDMKFRDDSVKYIMLMACLSFVGFGISIPFLQRAGLSMKDIMFKSLDLITTTVPPSLPACLGIGISYALSRLKKAGTMCINRERINTGGKVNMICFDKTGTLTEDHLDIYGFRKVKLIKNKFVFDAFEKNATLFTQAAYEHYKAKRGCVQEKNKNKDLNEYYVECLATCHSATIVNGKLVGDPIDVKMFEASDWSLFETENEKENNQNSVICTSVRPKYEVDLNDKISALKDEDDEEQIIKEHYELGIVRRFDFSSKLQRMSVIVKDVNDNYFKLFCKGSPEKIKELCRSDTIPLDFNEQLMKYTSKGFRVLAMSMKMMKMNYMQSQQITREDTECNMIFLGLLIVQNKLKAATQQSIETLDKAGIRMVMATGDNILTAIAVSKECKLISNDAVVYSCEIENGILVWNTIENFQDEDVDDVKNGNNDLLIGSQMFVDFKSSNLSNDPFGKVSFTHYFPPDNYSNYYGGAKSKVPNDDLLLNELNPPEQIKLDKDNGMFGSNPNKQSDDVNEDESNYNIEIRNYPFVESNTDEYVIAITGNTFESLLKLRNKYIETKKSKYKEYYHVIKTILRHGYVYARMSPEHKTLLVEALRQEQLTVLMCGDGANDCGALRAADIGVSLSPEEASIAAHFTSTTADISCLVKLLREGKASLVTSIQTFKYMMIYSIIQFCSVTLLMVNGSYLSDGQFLASDVFIIFPLAFFIAKTGAYPKLTHHQPTDSLISCPIISSILLQSFIAFGFQFGGWALLQYMNTGTEHDDNICDNKGNDVKECRDNTVIYLVSNMQYLITAFAFSISKPFRKPIYTNALLVLFMLFAFAFSVFIIVYYQKDVSGLLKLVDLDLINKEFKYWVLGLTLVNFVVSYFTEKWLVPGMNRCHMRRVVKILREKAKDPDFEYNLNQLQKMKNNSKEKKKMVIQERKDVDEYDDEELMINDI